MKLKTRILIQTISASFGFILLLSIVFFFSLERIRKTVLANLQDLGSNAANFGAYALEDQLAGQLLRIAQDTALFLDEKFTKIENFTRSTANMAEAIYTSPSLYLPIQLRQVSTGQITVMEPFIFAAPGVDLSAIRNETAMAGNISGMLRQVPVIDQVISTGAIGTESGFVIAMDAYPWPLIPFDPRTSPWYLGAKEKRGLFWTGVYADLRGRGPAITCAVPFYDANNGQLKGVARTTIKLSDFSRIIHSANLGQAGYIFILDAEGVKLFSSGSKDVVVDANGSIEGENFLESDNQRVRSLGMSMTLGASGLMELELNGVPVYAAYTPIHTLGWSLGVAIPVAEIQIPAWQINERITSMTGEVLLALNRNLLLLIVTIAFILMAALLAATFFSVRFTAAVSGPILALNEGVREVSGGNLNREVIVKTGDELEQLASSFNIMTENLREQVAKIAVTAAEQERMATELNVARQIQASMLPRDFPPFAGRKNEFDLFAEIQPAMEVGGDFYDFFFIDDDHFAIIVADVSGKGIPAALFMALAKTLVKTRLQSIGDLSIENLSAPGANISGHLTSAIETVNRQLCLNNIVDMFVTLWAGVLEISSETVFFINAGHNPPLVKSGEGEFDFMVSNADLFLAGVEETCYHCRQIHFGKGDTIFLYTDGITEAANRDFDFYGKERLKAFLNTCPSSMSIRLLFSHLSADIDRFSDGAEQFDDITMIALRFSEPKPEPKIEEEDFPDAVLSVPDTEATLTLVANVDELDRLFAFIGENLKKAGCPEDTKSRIKLASEEIFVNIANYAYKGSSGGSCEIMITTGSREAAIAFKDGGISFNPLEYEEPDTGIALEEREEGGLGIFIAKQIMDVVEYSYDGMNQLLMKKKW